MRVLFLCLKSESRVYMTAEFGASIALKDNFTSVIGTATKGIAKFASFSKQAQAPTKSFVSTGDALAGTFKRIVGGVAAVAGINSVKDAFNQSIAAAQGAQLTTSKFEAVMRNTGATAVATKGIESYASSLTNMGVLSKGVTLAGASTLATFSLQGSTIKSLTSAMDDLAVGTRGIGASQGDAAMIAKVMGKAMSGTTAGLSRYGIVLSSAQVQTMKYGTEQQKASALTAAIEARYKNLNQTLSQTGAGGMQKMQNQIAAMKVSLGNQLMPVQEKMMSSVTKILPVVSPILVSVATGIGNLATKALPPLQGAISTASNFVQSHMPQIKSTISSAVSTVSGTISKLLPVVSGVLNFLSTHQSLVGALASGILAAAAAAKVFAIAQGIVNAVMSANPIGIVITIIAALVGVFLYFWNTCKPFRQFWINLWNGVKTVVSTVFNAIRGFFIKWGAVILLPFAPFIALPILIVQHWGQITAFFSGLWSNIQGIFSVVGAWFAAVFQVAWSGVMAAFSGVGAFFTGIWSTITKIFTTIGTTIGNGIGGAFKAVVDSIIGFAENTINGFIREINGAIGLIDKIPGVKIGKLTELSIPRLAVGTNNFGGGAALVGERGPELVTMPKGAAVHTAQETKKMLGSGHKTEINITIPKLAEQFIVREDADIDRIAETLIKRIKVAAVNMA